MAQDDGLLACGLANPGWAQYHILEYQGAEGELNPDIEALFEYMNGGASSIGSESGSPLVRLMDGYVKGAQRRRRLEAGIHEV